MFNFKSSGSRLSNKKFKNENLSRQIIPIGIKTPLEPGDDHAELFKMNVDPLEQLADNLRNLVQTNHGERLGRFGLGCNLKSVLFDRNASIESDYEKNVTSIIQEQVRKYIPPIVINSIDINPESKIDNMDKTSLAKIVVKINFAVPILRRLENSIEVILYNAG